MLSHSIKPTSMSGEHQFLLNMNLNYNFVSSALIFDSGMVWVPFPTQLSLPKGFRCCGTPPLSSHTSLCFLNAQIPTRSKAPLEPYRTLLQAAGRYPQTQNTHSDIFFCIRNQYLLPIWFIKIIFISLISSSTLFSIALKCHVCRRDYRWVVWWEWEWSCWAR